MSTDEMSTLFSLLALGAMVLAVVTAVAIPLLRHSDRRKELEPLLLPLAFLIAATATAGSLYYSESANFTPCEFCWYQRIAMYPLALTLGVAALRRDLQVWWYALPPAIIGAGISIYHYQLQAFPDQGSSCDVSAPCTFRWVEKFGFVSIPLMALAGFAAIISLLGAAMVWGKEPPVDTDEDDTDDTDDTEPDKAGVPT